jgi:uncharacterized protein (TIGR02145 family)
MKRYVFLFLGILTLVLFLNCNPASSNNNIVSTTPDSPVLNSPINGATSISATPTLTWSTVSGAATYRVQVSTISTFATTLINDSSLTGGSKTLTTALSNNTKYYWRINGKNSAGTSAWSTVWNFTTISSSSNTTVTDADGNVYHTVTIGTQTWTVENLKTTKYNDGTTIPLVTDSTTWVNLTTAGYCWFNNDAATNKNVYGALYNWYTVNTGKLAPAGWHVPTDAEWNTLSIYLGGANISGGKLKESGTTHWSIPNTGATNESGFSALPGGCRFDNGYFDLIHCDGDWWSATVVNVSYAYSRNLGYGGSNLYRDGCSKSFGFSVRLVRD